MCYSYVVHFGSQLFYLEYEWATLKLIISLVFWFWEEDKLSIGLPCVVVNC